MSRRAGFTRFPGSLAESSLIGAGVLWLALAAWLLRGQLGASHGQLSELRKQCEDLSTLLFAALTPGLLVCSYLVGSTSTRVFGWALAAGLDLLWPVDLAERRSSYVEQRSSEINALHEDRRATAIGRELEFAQRTRERFEVHSAALPPFLIFLLSVTLVEGWPWVLGPTFALLLLFDASRTLMESRTSDALASRLMSPV